MRKHFRLKELITAVAIAAIGCSTYTHDAVQTNSPAPEVLRGASMTTAPIINSAGPASMTTPSAEALAITAANASYGGQFLGYIETTAASPSGNISALTGQVVEPALSVPNPEITVNSSISSGPNPIITSGAGEGGGLFVATANTPVATTGAITTNAGITSSVTAAPITSAATTANTTTTTANVTAAAPVIVTPSTVATPTNTANVITAGQFAAGVGGATTSGPIAIPNSGPLPIATGTQLANGNNGTLTPTLSSSRVPAPTVASNPPLAAVSNTNTRSSEAVFITPSTTASTPIVGTATIGARLGPAGMTSSSTITNSNTTTNRNGSIITTSVDEQLAARRQSIATNSASVTQAPATSASSVARQRAVRSSSVMAPVTQPAVVASRQRAVRMNAPVTVVPARQRPIHVLTAPDGTPIVTNVDTSSRPTSRTRDQVAPQQ